MTNKTKQRHDTLKRQAAFLDIKLPGEFPSDNDIRAAVRKKTGKVNFADYLAEQKCRREYIEFCDDDKNVVKPKRVQNVAGSSKQKAQGASGTGARMTKKGMGDTGTKATRGRQSGQISVLMILCLLLAVMWGISSLEDVMDSKEVNRALAEELVTVLHQLEVANLAYNIEVLEVEDLKEACLDLPKEEG